MRTTVKSVLVVLLAMAMASQAPAAKYFTDAGGPKPWDTATTANWGTVSGGPYNVSWANYDEAVFEGTGGTVNLSNPYANKISFDADGYVLTGTTLNMGNPGGTDNFRVNSTYTATISSGVSQPYGTGINKVGTGTLILNGVVTSTAGNNRAEAGLLKIGGGTFTGSMWIADGGSTPGAFEVGGGLAALSGLVVGTRGNATLTVSSGTLTASGGFQTGHTASSATRTANVNITGGTFNVTGGNIEVCAESHTSTTITQSGGSFSFGGGGWFYIGNAGSSVQSLVVSGGTFAANNTGAQYLAVRGTASITVTNTAQVTMKDLRVGHGSTGGASGVVHLGGGTLTLASFGENTGTSAHTSTFNFNGGTLKPSASTTTFMQGIDAANVQAGGAILDTAGFAITIGQVLAAGTPSGGVTKQGNGTLTLSAINTFTGALSVNGGTLAATAATAANPSALGGGANTINVASGATLLFSVNARTAGYHTGPVNLNGGTITFNTSDNSLGAGNTITLDTAAGTINGSSPGMWRMRGSATCLVNAAASGSTISGTFDYNLYDGTETFNVADGASDPDLTISAAMSGSANVTKSGAGKLRIGSVGAYTGNTTISGGTLEIVAGGTINNNGQIAIQSASLPVPTLLLNGGGITNANGGSAIYVGGTAGQTGAVSVVSGALTLTGGGGQAILIGDSGAGTWTQSGGTVNVTGSIWGANNNAGVSSATFNMGGGSFTCSGDLLLSQRGVTTMSISNTAAVRANWLGLVGWTTGSSSGTVNLNGGTLTVGTIAKTLSGQSAQGTATFNFNGGTLLPTGSNGSFMSGLNNAYVQSGGAFIDSTNYSITISQNLLAGTPSGALTKNGGGDLTLSGTSTYSGGTTATAGRLILSGASSAGSGSVTVVSGAEVYLTSGATLNNAFLISGDGGNSALDAQLRGALRIESGGVVGGAVTLQADASVGAYSGGSGSINGSIGESGGARSLAINKSSASTPGTITLGGANTFSGDTRIWNGTLTLANASALQNSTLDLNAADAGALSFGSLTAATAGGLKGSRNLTLQNGSSAAVTLTAGNNGQATTYSGSLSGSGALTKSGAGTLSLSGANTYAGGTTISGGTLQILAGGSINNGGQILIQSAGTPTPTLLLNGGSIANSNTGTAVYLGATAGQTGTVNIVSGTLTLTGGGGQAILAGNDGAGIWNQSGGTVSVTGSAWGANNNPGVSTAVFNMGGGTFACSANLLLSQRGVTTMSISNAAAVSANWLGLVGWTTGSSSGTMNLNGGTLTVGTIAKTLTGQSAQGTATFNFNGGTLIPTGNNASFLSGLNNAYVQAGGAIIDSTNYSITISQDLAAGTPSGGLTKLGTGTLTLTGTSGYTGGTTISSGTLQVGNGGTVGTLGSGSVIDNGTLTYSYNSSGTASLPSSGVSGSGNIISTAGVVQFNGNISLGGTQSHSQTGGGSLYTGLELVAASSTLTGSSITLYGDVGKRNSDGNSLGLDTSAGNGTINLNISLGRSGIWYIPAGFTANAGVGTINVTGTGPASSGWRSTPVTLTGGVNISANVNSDAAVTINATTNGSASGVLSGGMALTKGGVGTLTLGADNTYTGTTTINGGVLVLNTPNYNTYRGSTISINNGSTLTLTCSGGGNRYDFGGKQFTFDSNGGGTIDASSASLNWVFTGVNTFTTTGGARNTLLGASGMNLNGNSATFTVAAGTNPTSDLLVSGKIWNTGSITKNGLGTLELSYANSYSSGTTVNTGKLLLSNTSAAGGAGTALTLNGGTVELATDSAVSSKEVTLGGNAAAILNRASSGAGVATTFGSFTSTSGDRTLTVSKGTNVTSGEASLAFSGTWSSSPRTVAFDVGGGAAVYMSGGMAGGAQTVSLVKNGAGRLVLNGGYGTWDGGANIWLGGGTIDLQTIPGDSGNYRGFDAAAGTTIALRQDSAYNYYSGLILYGNMETVSERASAGAGNTKTMGTLRFLGEYALSVTGGTNVTSGTAGLTFSGAVTIDSNATFNVVNPVAGGTTLLTLGNVNQSGGTRTVTKEGNGELNLNPVGTTGYTGLTTINGGTFTVNGDTGDGTIRGNITVNSGGTLKLGTGDRIINTCLVTVNSGGRLDANGRADALAYLAGGGTVTNYTGTGFTLDLGSSTNSFSGTWTGSAPLSLRAANGAGPQALNGTVSVGAVTVGTTASQPAGLLLAGGSLTVGGDFTVSSIASGSGTFTLNAGTLTATAGANRIGSYGAGQYVQTGGNAIVGNPYIADGSGSTGVMTISGGAFAGVGQTTIATRGTGTLNVSGSAVVGLSTLWFNHDGGSAALATLNLSGGQITVGGDLIMGQKSNGASKAAQLTQTGGDLIHTGSTFYIGNYGISQMDLSGGSLSSSTSLRLAVRAQSTVNISGSASLSVAGITYGHGSGSDTSGTINLNGGTLTSGPFTKERAGTTATINFNGGTLKPNGSSGSFMSGLNAANVQDGGAVIDSTGFDVTIAQPLLAAGAGTGGLTKTGAGTVTLSGSNSYGGTTTVNGGVLKISGTLTGSTNTVVNSGGTMELVTAGNATLPDATAVRISAGGKMKLGAGVLETVQDLYLGGRHMWRGTWGSTSSGASYQDDTYFVAGSTGMLYVNSGAPHEATVISFQ